MELQEGKYVANLTNVDAGVSRTGTAGVWFEFMVHTMEGETKTIACWRYLTDKSAEYTLKDLATVGFTGNVDDPESLKDLANYDTEKEVELNLAFETYNEKTRLKVKFINEVGAGRFASADGDLVKKAFKGFGAKYENILKSRGEEKPPF